LTSVTFSPDGKLLFAGCWDKTVWSWDVQSKQPKQKYEGHSDFVKSVICARIDGQDILISGGADAKIIVHSIASGERLHVFKDHLRGILDLCIDPLAPEHDLSQIVLFSAASDREIRRFSIPPKAGALSLSDPLIVHETSIYRLYFDNDADLWTASADKTAKCLSREDGWKPNMVLEHPDFVKDVVVYEQGGWVLTACRDEEVRVWNKAVCVLNSMIWAILTLLDWRFISHLFGSF
jgi:WD40 repeat protein